MSVGYKRPFNETMDSSSASQFSLFSSINDFKRRRSSEVAIPRIASPSSSQSTAPVPLASRIANAISGRLLPGSVLAPRNSADNSQSTSRRNSIRDLRNSSLGNVSSTLRNSFGKSPLSRDSLLSDRANLQTHGFAIVGSHSLGVNAHKKPQQSSDVVRLKMALLQDYRNKLAIKERLLTDEFDAESARIIAERRKKAEEEAHIDEEEEEEEETTLTAQQKQQVDSYFSTARMKPRDVVVDAYRIELTFSDLATLRPGKWLNDNVIDMYMSMIVSQNPNVFVFTTHFFTRLEESGYSAVRRWALRKKLDVFAPDQVFVPVNRGNLHWTLAVVDNKNRKLAFYDSLPSGRGQRELDLILEYLKAEAKRMQKPSIPEYELVPNAKGPTQSNGSDCGVFVCETVTRLARGHKLNYTQHDMPNIRDRIAYSLISLKPTSKL